MIRELLHSEMKDKSFEGIDIQIIKKYVVKSAFNESFFNANFVILLIKSGRFKIKLEKEIQVLSEHDLLIIPKNSFCSILAVEGKLQLFLMSFTSEFVFHNSLKKELVDSFNFLIISDFLKIKLDERDFLVLSLIYKLVYFITKDYQVNTLGNEMQQVGFNLFLYELRLIYAKYNLKSSVRLSRKENITMEFLTVLTIHCKKQHSPKFYAGVLSITSAYLNKNVKQVTGQTVKKLIAQTLVTEAKVLLEDTQLSITFIAEELEFNSISNFSNFFKTYTNLTPSEYRSAINGTSH